MNTEVPWGSGRWTTAPASLAERDGEMRVTAVEGSDAWRHTAYGFVHDDEHSLLAPWSADRAVEVTFRASFADQFDQAGLMIRADGEHWIKTGAEFADGVLQLGAVVTHVKSDWSTGPVPDWAGREVTMRASRVRDGIAIRAKADDGPWRLVRLAPFDPDLDLEAGPFCCAPSRADLTVEFTAWRLTEPDADIH